MTFSPCETTRRGFLYESMDIKIKLADPDIAERVCGFAQNMNGVENAVFDADDKAVTIELSQNGSENVVRSAVEGYIEAMGGKAEGDSKKTHPRLKFVCRMAAAFLLAVVGAVLEYNGVETKPLFIFIAAYLIAGWDVFLCFAERIKEKRRPDIAGTAVLIVTAGMFVFGLYLPAVMVMEGYQCVIRNA